MKKVELPIDKLLKEVESKPELAEAIMAIAQEAGERVRRKLTPFVKPEFVKPDTLDYDGREGEEKVSFLIEHELESNGINYCVNYREMLYNMSVPELEAESAIKNKNKYKEQWIEAMKLELEIRKLTGEL